MTPLRKARPLFALGLMMVGNPPVSAQADRPVAALTLNDVITAMRDRCVQVTMAMTELRRRHPEKIEAAPDCGGVAAAGGSDRYAVMDDDTLLDTISVLSAELENLVEQGTAIHAAAASAPTPPARVGAKPPAKMPSASARNLAPASAPAGGKPTASSVRKKECEAQHLADVRLCSDSSCRMATYRRWQQCLETGRYW